MTFGDAVEVEELWWWMKDVMIPSVYGTGHNHVGHNYIGHNDMGHNYVALGYYHAGRRTTNSTSTNWTLGPVYNAIANGAMNQNVCATNISHNQSGTTSFVMANVLENKD